MDGSFSSMHNINSNSSSPTDTIRTQSVSGNNKHSMNYSPLAFANNNNNNSTTNNNNNAGKNKLDIICIYLTSVAIFKSNQC